MGFKESLIGIFNRIKNAVFIDKKELDNIIKELQKALISSDVDVELIIKISEKIKKEALRQDLSEIEKKELLTRLVYEEIIEILGGEKKEFKLGKNEKVLLIGLYGSGKTTSTVKLANYYNKKGLRCCVIGLDVHRPAAQEQLLQYAKKHNIQAFIDLNEKNPVKIWETFKEKIQKFDIVFIDSAGRDAMDKNLIDEIKKIVEIIKPSKTLLVISADIGQAAKKQAEFFSKAINIDGIMLTKMDGTAKAGGALASCKMTNTSVYFIGVGEKVNDIETFDARQYTSRLLGLGDLKTLVEKIQLSIEEEQRKKIEESLKEKKFTINDFYEQILAMQKVGSLKKIMEFIPISGINLPPGLLEIQEKKLQRWKYAIDSMTKKEKENPGIINNERMTRISKGSHVPIAEIKEMLKLYKTVKEFFSSKIDEKKIVRMTKKFKLF